MTDPDDAILASDADRDTAADVLAEAVAEGRLSLADQAARLDALFAARTRAEVTAVTAGLPAARVRRGGLYVAADAHRCVAVGGTVTRAGRFPIGRFATVTAVFGRVDLDLRAAVPAQREISLTIWSLAASVTITVPPRWGLSNQVLAIGPSETIADRDDDAHSPYLRIRGACIAAPFRVTQALARRPQVVARPRSGHQGRAVTGQGPSAWK